MGRSIRPAPALRGLAGLLALSRALERIGAAAEFYALVLSEIRGEGALTSSSASIWYVASRAVAEVRRWWEDTYGEVAPEVDVRVEVNPELEERRPLSGRNWRLLLTFRPPPEWPTSWGGPWGGFGPAHRP